MAFVVEQAVAFKRRDVDVRQAIVVVIGHGHAHAIHLHVQTAARRDVGERAVVIVSIQRRHRVASARRRILPVDQQNIGPAIAIQVNERDARAQRLRQITFPRRP